MNSFNYKWVYYSFTPIIVILILLLFLISRIDYTENIPQYQIKEKHSFNLSKHTNNLNETNLLEKFPYNIYLDSANYEIIEFIRKDLETLNSFSKDSMLNQQVLSIALTEKLDKRISSHFDRYNPDSLITIIQWAERFNFYAEIDKKNAPFYQTVYDYWMNFTIARLDKYYIDDYLIKYNFKFKYIQNRCKEKTYTGAIGNNQFEKVINNIIEKNWSYLINRFWIGTTFVFKLIITLFSLFTFYGYICIFRFHLKKNSNEKTL